MKRPWTSDDDHTLSVMYQRREIPMQLIRDTLHRAGPDIHERARQLGFFRPERLPAVSERRNTPQPQHSLGLREGRLDAAVNTLRRRGFSPVYAQRTSDTSTRETGLWVVGRMLLVPEDVIALARKCGQADKLLAHCSQDMG
jgi:hypothetical protein